MRLTQASYLAVPSMPRTSRPPHCHMVWPLCPVLLQEPLARSTQDEPVRCREDRRLSLPVQREEAADEELGPYQKIEGCMEARVGNGH
jgi:hypothetical protein